MKQTSDNHALAGEVSAVSKGVAACLEGVPCQSAIESVVGVAGCGKEITRADIVNHVLDAVAAGAEQKGLNLVLYLLSCHSLSSFALYYTNTVYVSFKETSIFLMK